MVVGDLVFEYFFLDVVLSLLYFTFVCSILLFCWKEKEKKKRDLFYNQLSEKKRRKMR
jgi:nicotinamide riboside transporter PnuC